MRKYPIISTENYKARHIIHRMLHQCNKRNIIYKGAHKTSSVLRIAQAGSS